MTQRIIQNRSRTWLNTMHKSVSCRHDEITWEMPAKISSTWKSSLTTRQVQSCPSMGITGPPNMLKSRAQILKRLSHGLLRCKQWTHRRHSDLNHPSVNLYSHRKIMNTKLTSPRCTLCRADGRRVDGSTSKLTRKSTISSIIRTESTFTVSVNRDSKQGAAVFSVTPSTTLAHQLSEESKGGAVTPHTVVSSANRGKYRHIRPSFWSNEHQIVWVIEHIWARAW